MPLSPYGIAGSLKRILEEDVPGILTGSGVSLAAVAGKYTGVYFGDRPTQAGQYPCIVIGEPVKEEVDYTFEGFKVSGWRVPVHFHGVELSDVETLAAAAEKALESLSARTRVAQWQNTTPEGVVIAERPGATFGRAGFDPLGDYSHSGRAEWFVSTTYQPNPDNSP